MKRQHPTDTNLFWCSRCNKYKNRAEFYTERRSPNNIPVGYCKICLSTIKKPPGYERERSRKRRAENIENWREYQRLWARKHPSNWQKINPDKHREHTRRWWTQHISALSDTYIRNQLRASYGANYNFTSELIELKRQQILMKRTLNEFKKWRKEYESNNSAISGQQHADEAANESDRGCQ